MRFQPGLGPFFSRALTPSLNHQPPVSGFFHNETHVDHNPFIQLPPSRAAHATLGQASVGSGIGVGGCVSVPATTCPGLGGFPVQTGMHPGWAGGVCGWGLQWGRADEAPKKRELSAAVPAAQLLPVIGSLTRPVWGPFPPCHSSSTLPPLAGPTERVGRTQGKGLHTLTTGASGLGLQQASGGGGHPGGSHSSALRRGGHQQG